MREWCRFSRRQFLDSSCQIALSPLRFQLALIDESPLFGILRVSLISVKECGIPKSYLITSIDWWRRHHERNIPRKLFRILLVSFCLCFRNHLEVRTAINEHQTILKTDNEPSYIRLGINILWVRPQPFQCNHHTPNDHNWRNIEPVYLSSVIEWINIVLTFRKSLQIIVRWICWNIYKRDQKRYI